jgi:hypothetical protein
MSVKAIAMAALFASLTWTSGVTSSALAQDSSSKTSIFPTASSEHGGLLLIDMRDGRHSPLFARVVRGGGVARRGGGAYRGHVAYGARGGRAAYGARGGVAYRRGVAVGPRGGVYRGGAAVVGRGVAVRRPVLVGGVYRPYGATWRPGGAIAAGAAVGFVTAATAAAWAGAPPSPGYCWYYTDSSRTQGFWDVCPQ